MTAPLRNKNHSLPVFQLMEPAGFLMQDLQNAHSPAQIRPCKTGESMV